MKKQLFWLLVILTIFAGFLIHRNVTSAQDMAGVNSPNAPTATVIDAWSFENIALSSSPGSSPVLTSGSAKADSGAQTSGSAFTGSHASSATVWSLPAGNGSAHSLSSNNWAIGDFIQFNFNTNGFTGISLTWDQVGSATGPRDFKVQYSVNGGPFKDATGTNSTYQVLSSPAFSSTTPVSTHTRTLDLSGDSSVNGSIVVVRLVVTTSTAINGGTVTADGTSAIDNFTVSASGAAATPTPTPAPAITSITPNSGPTSGGTSVVITGTNLSSMSTSVSFGGTSASFSVDSSTQITATSPAHVPGTVDITVTTLGGTSATSASDRFTYVSGGTTPGPSSIEFSAGNYSVGEGDGHIDITVIRTGDTSGSATVDYTTFDENPAGPGHASQTSDYEIALGTLTFAPGETSKTFTVLIVDDNLVEGNETVGLSLTNATGTNVSLGTPSTAELTIIDNDMVSSTTNPYDDPRFFVRQQYLDFLNREPDQSGWDFWTLTVTQCGTDAACTEVHRINVSAAFFLSKEFQNTGYLAYLTHRTAFGPNAGSSPAPVLYTTFMHDVQELGKGYIDLQPGADQVLEANKVAYFNDFVNRPEFLVRYPASFTNQQFVDSLLTTASLPTTGSFRDSLLNGLNGGTMTRATVLRAIAESLHDREFNAGFVTMEYFGYLRRDPDTSGFNFWLAKLNAFNGNFIQAEMVKAFIESTEDRQRFGTP